MFVKNFLYNASDRVAILTLRIAAAILIGRILGPKGYGIFHFAVVTSLIISSISELGLGIANNYYASNRKEERRYIFANTALLTLGLGTLAAIFSYFFLIPFRNRFFQELPSTYLIWIPLSIPIQTFTLGLIGILFGTNMFRDKLIGTLLHHGGFLIAIAGLSMTTGLDVNLLFPLWVLGLLLGTLYFISILALRGIASLRVKGDIFRSQISYGKHSYLYNIANLLNFRLDMFLVATFLGSKLLGLYGLAVSVADSFLYFPKALSNVILTDIASNSSSKTKINYIFSVVLTVSLGIVVLVLIFAPSILPLIFSKKFEGSVLPLFLLMPGFVFMSLGIIASFCLFGIGEASSPSLAALVATIVTFVLDLILIPLLDIKGAAIASSISYLIFMSVCLYRLSRRIQISVSLRPFLSQKGLSRGLGILRRMLEREALER
jgi:O-antigen/teichoic acid export membrane protein